MVSLIAKLIFKLKNKSEKNDNTLSQFKKPFFGGEL